MMVKVKLRKGIQGDRSGQDGVCDWMEGSRIGSRSCGYKHEGPGDSGGPLGILACISLFLANGTRVPAKTGPVAVPTPTPSQVPLPSWCPHLGALVSEAVTITPTYTGSLQGQGRAGGPGRCGLVTAESLVWLVTPHPPTPGWSHSPSVQEPMILGVTSGLWGPQFLPRANGQTQRWEDEP